MRQMEICKKCLKLQKEEESTLVYFVIINDLDDTPNGILLEMYGVGVAIAQTGESAIIPNITFSKTSILTLIDLLAHHLVTPVSAHDIVDDWLCR